MARQKTRTARPAEQHAWHKTPEEGTRRFRSRGVDVEIRALRSDAVELKLDGVPIEVEVVDGKFHSQLAHMFTAFDSIDALVDTLLANEGRVWTLHGGDMTGPHGGQRAHDDPEPGAGHVHGSRSPGPRRRGPAKTERGRGGTR